MLDLDSSARSLRRRRSSREFPRARNRDRGGKESRISDEVLPYQAQLAPERPQPIELGPAFLGTGKIGPGFELPGGAVWQPQLLIWGTARTAVQAFDPEGDDDTRVSDWSNRLDIFAEVEVSPTDRDGRRLSPHSRTKATSPAADSSRTPTASAELRGRARRRVSSSSTSAKSGRTSIPTRAGPSTSRSRAAGSRFSSRTASWSTTPSTRSRSRATTSRSARPRTPG